MKNLKVKIFTFVNNHQVPVIIGSFLLLPVLILGSIMLVSAVRNRSTSEVAITPTPTIKVSPEPTDEPDEEEDEPTSTPTKKITQSPTPKSTSTPGATTRPTNTPGPTATSAPTKHANILFQSVNCTYHPIATSSGSKKINDTTFANTSEVPSTSTCEIDFKNVEDVETGDITYQIFSDSDQKKVTVGKLKKDETKKVTEIVELKKSTGSHFIKVLLNPDKTFSETDYNDNTYQANYTVQ